MDEFAIAGDSEPDRAQAGFFRHSPFALIARVYWCKMVRVSRLRGRGQAARGVGNGKIEGTSIIVIPALLG